MSLLRTFGICLAAFIAGLVPAFAQGTWQVEGNLLAQRTNAAAVTLTDGRILVVGGAATNPNDPPRTSEVFDPATGASLAVPMLNPRFNAGAVTLLDGRVLVAGGQAFGAFVFSAELFDPVTNSWSFAAAPTFGNTPPALFRMPDGRVFYGLNAVPQLYDPASNTWTGLASSSDAHIAGTALQLPDGRIVMAGGLSGPVTEIYDLSTNSWTSVAPMPAWLFSTRGVVLPDGTILIAGGTERPSFTASNAAFLYDVSTNTWTSAGTMSAARRQFTLDLLPNGEVLAAGGNSATSTELAGAELYSPLTNSWSPAPNLPAARSSHVSSPSGDRLYFFGGRDTTQVDSFIRNRAPVANAGTDAVLQGCLACVTAAPVSGAASSDPDGDALTYEWRLGASVLLTTSSPTATLPMSPGVNVVTLTVRDALGVEASDNVAITVNAVDSGYLDQIAALQTAVEACEAAGNATPELDSFEQYLRTLFADPSFQLPGATGPESLQSLLDAFKKLPKGQQQQLYKSLKGS